MPPRIQQRLFKDVRMLDVECKGAALALPKMFAEHFMVGAVGRSIWLTEVDGRPFKETPAHVLTRNAGSVFEVRANAVAPQDGWFRGLFISKTAFDAFEDLTDTPVLWSKRQK